MGVREAGSYVIDAVSGEPTLVERTEQFDANLLEEPSGDPEPVVVSAPAASPAPPTPPEPAASATSETQPEPQAEASPEAAPPAPSSRRRGAPDSPAQE